MRKIFCGYCEKTWKTALLHQRHPTFNGDLTRGDLGYGRQDRYRVTLEDRQKKTFAAQPR